MPRPSGTARHWLTRFALAILLTGLIATATGATRQLTTAKDVVALSSDEAAKRHPVRLRGVVTFSNEEKRTLFIQDNTGGVFVDCGRPFPSAESGSLVEVIGYSDVGRYKSIVGLVSLTVLGKGDFPRNNPATLAELWTGKHDCDWVTVRAHVRSHEIDRKLTGLNLADGSSSVDAWVNDFPADWLPKLDFAEVELSGPTSVAVSDDGKIIGIGLWLPDTNQFRILRTGAEVVASLPERTVQSIVDTNTPLDPTRPVRVTGTVTHASRRFGVKVQDGTMGLTVLNFDQPLPSIGRQIEVIGWPQRTERATQILSGRMREIGDGKTPAPLPVSIADAYRGTGEGTVVTMEGLLRHRMVADQGNIWILEKGGSYFEAVLPSGMEDARNPMVIAGTSVRLTGVLLANDSTADKPNEPSVLLRSTADIEILSAPPWPAQRVLIVISITLALHAIGLLALAVLYTRLRRRTSDLTAARYALESSNRELEGRVESRTRTLYTAHEALRESEERFRQLASHISEIFWMGTADNKQVLYLSPGFETICGRSVDEVYQKPETWSDLVHPDDRNDVFKAALGQPVTEEYDIEYRIVRPDGAIRWLRDRAFPVRDESGAIYRVAGIAEDITERKLAEEELREQHIALTNAMPGISRLDLAGNYTYVNGHYARMSGYRPEELIGTPFSITIHPEDMLTAMRAFEQMQATGKSEAEIRGARKDRSIFWKHVLLVRITQSDGKTIGHHCFMRDITSRKHHELLLEGQKAALETIASGASLHETLDTIARFIETRADETFASILLLSDDGRHLQSGASPSLPAEFIRSIDNLEIGPMAGACGTAAFTRQRVTVTDIATDPLMAPFKIAATAPSLRACTSTPILGSNGNVLGAIAIYFKTTRGPTPDEEHLTHLATQLAAIAIEQERIQHAERDAQDRYRSIVASAMDAVITLDENQRVQVFNHAAETMFRCTEKQAVDQPLASFIPERQRALLSELLERLGATGGQQGGTVSISGQRRNGEEFPIEASISQTTLNGRKLITAILRDVTEKHKAETTRSQLEKRLRQAQKMEAIGTLAGGIAHDFNNILGAVMLNIELARGDIPPEHPAQEYINALRSSSIRARDLVRQILAFSRQQEHQRSVLRLERVITEAHKLIRAALPASIEIHLRLTSDGPSIIADPTQLHQVLTNLCTNAAHAMRERGGLLDIRQHTVTVDAALAATCPDLQPGQYVQLTISDTGTGMLPEVIERIFDPFFTTKDIGEGTGLGLAVVHGIMKDHDGAIVVESVPDKGTIFHLYFPAVDLPEVRPADDSQPIPRGHGQRVLVVDDEDALLKVHQRMLERLGYTVTGFTSPTLALEAFRASPGQYDLVITDLAMPGMSGVDLSRELKNFRPQCPVIITTGYTTSLDPQNLKSLGIAGLIFKPATAATIGETVHRALSPGHGKSM